MVFAFCLDNFFFPVSIASNYHKVLSSPLAKVPLLWQCLFSCFIAVGVVVCFLIYIMSTDLFFWFFVRTCLFMP